MKNINVNSPNLLTNNIIESTKLSTNSFTSTFKTDKIFTNFTEKYSRNKVHSKNKLLENIESPPFSNRYFPLYCSHRNHYFMCEWKQKGLRTNAKRQRIFFQERLS